MEKDLREKIQKEILKILSIEGFFNQCVFHGGSCLRLFYHNVRRSEDLDFVRRREKSGENLDDAIKTVKKALKKAQKILPGVIYEIENLETKLQKHSKSFIRFVVKVQMKGERKKTEIDLKIANVPAYTIAVKFLNGFPVVVEKPHEIFADKVVSILTTMVDREQPEVKDLVDIHYLKITLKISEKEIFDFVFEKFEDYGLKKEEIYKGLLNFKKWLENEKLFRELITETSKKHFPLYMVKTRHLLETYTKDVFNCIKKVFAPEIEKILVQKLKNIRKG